MDQNDTIEQNGKAALPKTADGQDMPKHKKPSLAGRLFVLFTFILAVSACAACVYLWYLHQRTLVAHDTEVAALKKTLRSLDEHPSLVEFKNHISEQNAHFAQQLQELRGVTRSLEESLSKTIDLTNRQQRDWVLAEAEYLIRIAHTRAQLMRDTNTAIVALSGADQRIASLADPRLIDVRKKLADEITALKNLTAPDIDGALLRLSSIARRLPQLPVASIALNDEHGKNQPADTAASTGLSTDSNSGDHWWTSLVNRIKRIIGFRPDTRISNAVLARKNEYYLDQLLRLEIESARQAAIRLDKQDFEYRLGMVKKLLDEHYDASHELVIALKQDVVALQQLPVFQSLPELSGSLTALLTFSNRYTVTQN